MTKLVTNNYKINDIYNIIEDVQQSSYYIFVADHIDNGFAELEDLDDKPDTVFHQAYNNMIFGKKVTSADIVPLIRDVPYESNIPYDMYDHTDPLLKEKNFYVSVNEGSYIHIYKCLDNNRGANSTAVPTFSHIAGSNTELYKTSDGYSWKYMYTISDGEKLKFATDTYIPVIANNEVSQQAIRNRIDVIKVEGTGRRFDNYVESTFDTQDITVGGNNLIYKVSVPEARNVNGFYTDCLLYISSGTGSSQYRKVINYFANTTGKYVVIDSAFATRPTNLSEYQIYPSVEIKATGQSSNVVARAVINALASNSVHAIEILNKGNNFTYWASADVIANSVVQAVPAELKVILSPYNGHGFDPARELYADRIEFYAKFANSEANTIPLDNGFKQIGLLKNPLFQDVVVEYSETSGIFLVGEQVKAIIPKYISNNAVVDSDENTVFVPFDDYPGLSFGDEIYLTDSNLNYHQIANVVAINSTAMTINANPYFTTTAKLYKIETKSELKVDTSNTSTVTFSQVTAPVVQDDILVGTQSGAMLVVNTVSRSGLIKGFDTFIALKGYKGEIISGEFDLNETIYQSSINNANAVVHSYTNNLMYTTNEKGSIVVGENRFVVGTDNEGVFKVESIRKPEIEFGSGEILYLENIEYVKRSGNTSEILQLIFEY